MAKDISITEGGKSALFAPTRRLVTSLQEGGTCAWVPEDETKTKTLSTRENGTFYPDEGYYGFSKVTVNVPKGISGTGHNIDGLDPDIEYFFEVDDGGNIVTTELPSSIVVTTPPTKTSYTEGETIDFTGIEVTAYLGDGNAYDTEDYPNGVIPFSELVFPDTEATASSAARYDSSLNAGEVVFHLTAQDEPYVRISQNVDLVLYRISTQSNRIVNLAYETYQYVNGVYNFWDSGALTGQPGSEDDTYVSAGSGVIAYKYPYGEWVNPNTIFEDPNTGITGAESNIQQVPVNWKRPHDQNELSTTFPITVSADSGFSGSGGGTF